MLSKRIPNVDEWLNNLDLKSGAHSPDGQFCVMEAAAYIAGEPWSASPKCVSPILTAYCVPLNDKLPHQKRQLLKPYIPRMIGTAGDGKDLARSYVALDWLLRTWLPAWLELTPELKSHAAILTALPAIRGAAALTNAKPFVIAAQKEADAAMAAAGAAARAAAGAAAMAVAMAALIDAAWAAARAAAWAAAGAAAMAVAMAAAGAAAGAAAMAAAGAAARAELQSTVDRLQDSAIELLDQIISPPEAA